MTPTHRYNTRFQARNHTAIHPHTPNPRKSDLQVKEELKELLDVYQATNGHYSVRRLESMIEIFTMLLAYSTMLTQNPILVPVISKRVRIIEDEIRAYQKSDKETFVEHAKKDTLLKVLKIMCGHLRSIYQ
jgi:hypothetical protein